MTKWDRRPRPDSESLRAAVREMAPPKVNEYCELVVLVDGVVAGEPVAKRSTLQSEINAIFDAAINDPGLHGHSVEVRVLDHGWVVDVQVAEAHSWGPLDLRGGRRQVCRTCGVERGHSLVE